MNNIKNNPSPIELAFGKRIYQRFNALMFNKLEPSVADTIRALQLAMNIGPRPILGKTTSKAVKGDFNPE